MITLFLALRVSALFLVVFLWIFLPHRYPKWATLLLALLYAATGVLDHILCRTIRPGVSAAGNLALFVEALLVLGTAVLISQQRDSGVFLVAMTSCTSDLAIVTVNCVLCALTDNPLTAMIGSVLFGTAMLSLMVRNNRKVRLSELPRSSEGRRELCLIPALAFVALYVTCVLPGNVFLIPECRIIAVVMIAVTLSYYHLVLTLLRTRAESDALASSNELLESYAACLRRRMEDTKKAQEKLSILRHDLRHRNQMILYYLDTNDTASVRNLAEVTASELDSTAEKQYCRNGVLNMILAQIDQTAAAQNVEFRCAAEIPDVSADLTKELEFEFATVVLNLLENAVRAAAAQTDPKNGM